MVVLIILLKVIPMDVLMVGVLMIIPIVITMVSAGGVLMIIPMGVLTGILRGSAGYYSDGCSYDSPNGFCLVLF